MTATSQHVCTFRLDGHLYGFDLAMVREVHPPAPWVVVPKAPPEVHGLVNLRGRIHLILDLRQMLNLKSLAPSADHLFILFREVAGESFGVVVDAIGEILSIDGKDLEWKETERNPKSSKLIDGVLTHGEEILTRLRANAVLGALSHNRVKQGAGS